MNDKRMVQVSKFLSKHLRHEPEAIGLTLQPGGWVEVELLLDAVNRASVNLTRAELDELVRRSDKQRFAFDASGARIRANQGHSVEVDLQLEPVVPPDVLYHGTAEHVLALIFAEGLKKMDRHHVHLSDDLATAVKVGQRHGKPVVLSVDAAAMRDAGTPFYRSANGVWLVEAVAPEYLQVIDR